MEWIMKAIFATVVPFVRYSDMMFVQIERQIVWIQISSPNTNQIRRLNSIDDVYIQERNAVSK